jgi:hypothetical protein
MSSLGEPEDRYALLKACAVVLGLIILSLAMVGVVTLCNSIFNLDVILR